MSALKQTGSPPAQQLPRVALNAQLLSLEPGYRGAGVSHYIHSLLTWLPRVESRLRWLALMGHTRANFPGWEQQRAWWPTSTPPLRILWEQLAQPCQMRRAGVDLVHAPVYVGPLVCRSPVVVTLHDLSFYLYPELFRPFQRNYLRKFTRLTVRRAAGVIAVSESTRTDAIRILGVPPERITVIHNGVDDEMRPLPADQVSAFRRRRSLPEKMILFLGTLEPRKNIVTLLEAFALLRREGNLAHQLVVAGGRGWYYEEIEIAVQRLGLQDLVIFPGYVDQKELPLWYNAAELFVYPSIYEGFGLPPLESMACGTPVVAANTSSLPEVVGDAGILVNPLDSGALAEAMKRVLGDPEAGRTLRNAGLERAKQLSWRNTAEMTAQFYHRVLETRDV